MTTAACVSHPSREAIGVCIECRAQVCSECVTKVDGINHCVTCYGRSADRETVRRDAGAAVSTPVAWLFCVGGFGVASLLAWAALEILLPGSG